MTTSSRSQAIFTRAQAVMPSGYTRHLAVTKPHPQYAALGQGCWITDVDGQRKIDFLNNFASLIHGHAHPAITALIAEQAGRLLCTVLPTEWEVKLAELLVERIPSVEKVRFMNTGTEVVMLAVKVARAATGRSKVAKMEGGYHGQYDLIEASFQPPPSRWGDPARPTAVAHSAGTPQSLLDELVLLPVNDIENSRARLREEARDLAAVIIDPNRLQMNLVEPRHDYLAMLREETERLGIVLIFDEVFCLRTGYHGTQGLLGVTPDLTTMGKIIGGGLPIGALGGKSSLMAVFDVDGGEPKVHQSGTFSANPLSTAAGHTGMTLMTRDAFDDLAAKGQRLRDGMTKALHDLKVTGRVEGRASLSSLLLTDRPTGTYRELAAVMAAGLSAKMQALQKALVAEGVLTMRGGFIGSTPMTNDDIDFTVDAVRRALVAMHA